MDRFFPSLPAVYPETPSRAFRWKRWPPRPELRRPARWEPRLRRAPHRWAAPQGQSACLRFAAVATKADSSPAWSRQQDSWAVDSTLAVHWMVHSWAQRCLAANIRAERSRALLGHPADRALVPIARRAEVVQRQAAKVADYSWLVRLGRTPAATVAVRFD